MMEEAREAGLSGIAGGKDEDEEVFVGVVGDTRDVEAVVDAARFVAMGEAEPMPDVGEGAAKVVERSCCSGRSQGLGGDAMAMMRGNCCRVSEKSGWAMGDGRARRIIPKKKVFVRLY